MTLTGERRSDLHERKLKTHPSYGILGAPVSLAQPAYSVYEACAASCTRLARVQLLVPCNRIIVKHGPAGLRWLTGTRLHKPEQRKLRRGVHVAGELVQLRGRPGACTAA